LASEVHRLHIQAAGPQPAAEVTADRRDPIIEEQHIDRAEWFRCIDLRVGEQGEHRYTPNEWLAPGLRG